MVFQEQGIDNVPCPATEKTNMSLATSTWKIARAKLSVGIKMRLIPMMEEMIVAFVEYDAWKHQTSGLTS